MVGSIEGARAALAGDLTYVASGCERSVFLDGDVVYKVQIGHLINANVEEYDNYLAVKLHNYGPHIRIPETSLFDVDGKPVIAMQYINGQPKGECNCEMADEECDEWCLPQSVIDTGIIGDWSGMNTIQDNDGIFWVIDLEA